MILKRIALISALLILVAGCAPKLDYRPIEAQMSTGNCQGAVSLVDGMQQKYGKNQQLLYHMDSGMLNLYCGNS